MGSKSNPAERTHTLYVSTRTKSVLTERGIGMFTTHEVGTHLMRALNDALQVWAVDSTRPSWGLGRLGTRQSLATEEGLATLHTALHQGKAGFKAFGRGATAVAAAAPRNCASR